MFFIFFFTRLEDGGGEKGESPTSFLIHSFFILRWYDRAIIWNIGGEFLIWDQLIAMEPVNMEVISYNNKNIKSSGLSSKCLDHYACIIYLGTFLESSTFMHSYLFPFMLSSYSVLHSASSFEWYSKCQALIPIGRLIRTISFHVVFLLILFFLKKKLNNTLIMFVILSHCVCV